MKEYTRFRIQGDNDWIDNKPLYWDNKDGWTSFNNGTIFHAFELYIINFPISSQEIKIAWIDENGELIETDDLPTAFGRSEVIKLK